MYKYIISIFSQKEKAPLIKNNQPYELTKEEMLLKTSLNDPQSPKNIIGPLFVLGGTYGFIKGAFRTIRTKQYMQKRFLITSLINNISYNSLRYANALGGLGLIFCFTRQTINFFLDDEMKKITNLKRNTIYGIASGMVYKSTRGLGPSLLSGFIVGNCCFALTYYINLRNKNRNKLIFKQIQN